MKRNVVLWVILICLFGCEKIDEKKQKVLNDPSNNCKRIGKLSYEELKEKYPLVTTSSILLISFELPKESNDSLNFPVMDKQLLFNKLKEYKTLDTKNSKELVDILYNYDFDPDKESVVSGALCYDPVNAIIFLNKSGDIEDYLEICFSCSQVRYNTSKIKFGGFCQGKLDLLENLFIANGLKNTRLEY